MATKFFPRLSSILLVSVFCIFFIDSVSAQNMFRKISDFDGDGKTDFVITRNENGLKVWYIWQSRDGFKVFQWGLASDQITAGDYDGDSKTDFAVFRETNQQGIFYILQSQDNLFVNTTILNGSISPFTPIHQDYDGDGKTDPAVRLIPFSINGNIYIVYSRTNSFFATQVPSGNFPIKIGDMDGDGRAEKAHYVFDTNVVTITSLVTGSSRSVQFGSLNDSYLPADFDGDGIGDLTVWRRFEGNWYWLRSSDGTFQTEHWGLNGDIPVPGDYDGDGKTDLAIWRRSSPQSQYWINGSQNGISVFSFGISTDTPVIY